MQRIVAGSNSIRVQFNLQFTIYMSLNNQKPFSPGIKISWVYQYLSNTNHRNSNTNVWKDLLKEYWSQTYILGSHNLKVYYGMRVTLHKRTKSKLFLFFRLMNCMQCLYKVYMVVQITLMFLDAIFLQAHKYSLQTFT